MTWTTSLSKARCAEQRCHPGLKVQEQEGQPRGLSDVQSRRGRTVSGLCESRDVEQSELPRRESWSQIQSATRGDRLSGDER